MAKHANNKSATDEEVSSKTRAVVADVSGSKAASANEKRAEKCKEKCPANIKECCRNAIAGNQLVVHKYNDNQYHNYTNCNLQGYNK